jgi:hypothetical protein
MLYSSLVTLAMAGVAAAAPFSLSNGFPNPSASALKQIELEAGGTLPNTALPTSLPADAIQTLQVIATNELFEVAYFSSLLHNVSTGVSGYTDFGSYSKEYVVESLTAIRAVSGTRNVVFFQLLLIPLPDYSKRSCTHLVQMQSSPLPVARQLVLATTCSQ